MVVANLYWTRKNILNLGIETEDTKIGGSGTFGTDPAAGLVTWPDDLIDMTFNPPGTFKEAQPQLGNTDTDKLVQIEGEKYNVDIRGYMVEEYHGYGSIMAYVLGLDPTGAVSELKSTTTANQGVITKKGQVGSFVMEGGFKDDDANEYSFLWKGDQVNRVEIEVTKDQPIQRRVNIMAATLTPTGTIVTRAGDDLDALSAQAGRRAMFDDLALTFTTTGSTTITPDIRYFSMVVDRRLEHNPVLGAAASVHRPCNAYLVSGEIHATKKANNHELFDIAKAYTGGEGVSYLKSLQAIIDNDEGATQRAYFNGTMSKVALNFLGTQDLTPGHETVVEKFSYMALAKFSNAQVFP